MRRAERLFQLLNILRNRRTAITADQLAGTLETSVRTIYRDVQSLVLSGVPIEGEAGVGYRLQGNFDLPPLMFDARELEALLLGVRMVRAWSDKDLAASSNSALQKILAVVPDALREKEKQFPVYAPEFAKTEKITAYSPIIRRAIENNNVISIDYARADGEKSTRFIEPLGLFFWGSVWTLLAWCQSRDDYRSFRLDRIVELTVTNQMFNLSDSKSVDYYLSHVVTCE